MVGITRMVQPLSVRQLVFFAMSILATAFFAFAVSVQSASAASQTVATGIVTDISDSSPLQGVTVECHTPNGNVTGNDATLANGTYACAMDTATLVNGDTIVVEVSDFAGYQSPEGQNLTWNGVSQPNITFQMTPAPKTVNVIVKNDTGGFVNADVFAQPVAQEAGAPVQVSGSASDTDGSATLEMTGGKWIVGVEANLSELDADRYPWIAVGPPQEVEFAEDSTTEVAALEFTVIQSVYKVQVKVLDASGNILTGNSFNGDIYFDGYNSDYGSLNARRKINATTGVAEVYLMPGVWKVSAYHQQLDGQSLDPEDATFVLPDSPGTTDWGTITAVVDYGSISGTLTIPNDTVRGNTRILATNLDTGRQTQGQTNQAGAWSISNLGPGEYAITVGDEKYAPVQTGSAVLTKTKTSVTGIELTANFMDAELVGVVKDAGGTALADFQGSVVVTDGATEFSAPVQADGSYTLPIFTDGLELDGLEMKLVTMPGADEYQVESIPLTLTTGTTAQDVSTASNEAFIGGNVKDFDNVSLTSATFGEGMEVMALNIDTGSVEKATVGADGSFSMNVGPGEWSLVPQMDDKDATAFASNAAGNTFTVTAGEAKTVDVNVQSAAGTVAGTITDKDGNTVAEAPVLLTNLQALQDAASAAGTEVNENEIVSVVVNTDSVGKFSQPLPEGEFTTTFGSNPEVADEVEPLSKTVTVTTGSTSDASSSFREATGAVEGSIGKNFEVGTVSAFSAEGGTEKVEVNTDGSFDMNLAPGDWTVMTSGVKNGEVFLSQEDLTVTAGSNSFSPSLTTTGIDFPAATSVTGDSTETISLTNTDGASVMIPAYSAGFSGNVTVSLQPVIEFNNSGDISQVGLAYEVQVVDSEGIPIKSLNRDATVTLPIDEALKGSVANSEMTAGYHNEELESFLYDGMVAKTDGDKMVIQTDHFSKFAVTTTGEVAVAAAALTKPLALKAKNIKKKSARLTFKAPASGTYTKFKVQVRECKNVTKKKCKKAKHYKKKKTWKKYNKVKKQASRVIKRKNVTKLETGTFHQFRVRAVNNTDNGPWAKWKRFKTKGSRA